MGGTIDWVATGTMLTGLGTIAGALAVTTAAIIGADTFGKWRQQKLTERKMVQAERILTATYQARRVLRQVRSPWMDGNERAAAEDEIKGLEVWRLANDQKKKRLVTAQSFFNRIKRTRTEQDALYACLPVALALFGGELEKAIEELHHQFWNLQVLVDAHVDDEGVNAPDFTAEIFRAMYDVERKGFANEINDKVAQAVQTIEGICLPVLQENSIK